MMKFHCFLLLTCFDLDSTVAAHPAAVAHWTKDWKRRVWPGDRDLCGEPLDGRGPEESGDRPAKIGDVRTEGAMEEGRRLGFASGCPPCDRTWPGTVLP